MSSPSARPHSKSLFRGTILRRRLRMASREMPQKASLTRFISRPAMSPSCVFRAYNAPYNAFVSVWAYRLLMPFPVPLRAAILLVGDTQRLPIMVPIAPRILPVQTSDNHFLPGENFDCCVTDLLMRTACRILSTTVQHF